MSGNKRENAAEQLRAKVYHFILDHFCKHRICPSFREISHGTGVSVGKHMRDILTRLADDNLIRWSPGKKRGISLPEGTFLTTQLIGTIAGGVGVDVPDDAYPPDDPIDTLSLPRSMIPRGVNPGQIFALRVDGNSMRDDGVEDGDVVFLIKAEHWDSQTIMAVFIKGEQTATLKRLVRKGRGQIELRPANPAFPSRIVSPDEIVVHGRVLAVIKKL